jgi:predicted esterase
VAGSVGRADGILRLLKLIRMSEKSPGTNVRIREAALLGHHPRLGSPRIFVSHGMRDGVLPIDRCSRRILPELKRGGYDVRYREFDGEHSISLEIVLEAIGWFTQVKFS